MAQPSMEPGELYAAHLKTQGVEPSALQLEEDGTVRSADPLAQEPALSSVQLPLVPLGERSGPEQLLLLSTLGVGGMGKVMLALQQPLNREVAVKLPKSPEGHARALPELLREAMVTGRLEHPNIVPVHLLGRAHDGAPFFVMKRIEGVSWRELLEDPAAFAQLGRRVEDPLGFHLGVLLEVCDAVAFAHSRGVLHRDLKPDNVMLGRFGEVYLVDWGIAVTTSTEPLLIRAADAQGLAGTPGYMAPEMASAQAGQLSERTDVFLLGAVLHHVLTGRPPYAGPSLMHVLAAAFDAAPPSFPADVPQELAALCRKAMARLPAERFASAQQLRDALEGFLRRRDSSALAAEAERRVATLEEVVVQRAAAATGAGSTAASATAAASRGAASTGATSTVSLDEAFTECRFAYRQLRGVPGREAAATEGLTRALVAMARACALGDNLEAAEAYAAQLDEVPALLAAELSAAAQRAQARAARVAALERLEQDSDLDLGVALRSRLALGSAVSCAGALLVLSVLHRQGLIPFGYREVVLGFCGFAACVLVLQLRFTQLAGVNAAHRRLLRGNTLGLASMLLFWLGAWALQVPFTVAVVGFCLHVSTVWALGAALFDRRLWPPAATYLAAALPAALLPGWQPELFAVATFVGYGAVGLTWSAREKAGLPA
jgi:serine/threonine-protein kinase